CGFAQCLPQSSHGQLLIDEAQDNDVQGTQSSCFGRSEKTTKDTAQDDDWGEHSSQHTHRSFPNGTRSFCRTNKLIFIPHDVQRHVYEQCSSKQERRKHRCSEERTS